MYVYSCRKIGKIDDRYKKQKSFKISVVFKKCHGR